MIGHIRERERDRQRERERDRKKRKTFDFHRPESLNRWINACVPLADAFSFLGILFVKLSEIDLFSWIWYSYSFRGKVFPTQVVQTVFKHKLAQPTALVQQHLERWGCVALCGYIFLKYATAIYHLCMPFYNKNKLIYHNSFSVSEVLSTNGYSRLFFGPSGKHGKINNLANHTKKQAKRGQETIENTDEKSIFTGAIHVSRVWGPRSRNFTAKIRHGSPKVFRRRRGPRAQPFLGRNRSKVKRKKNQSGHSLSPYIDVMTGTVGFIVDQKSWGCKSGGNYNMFFQKNEWKLSAHLHWMKKNKVRSGSIFSSHPHNVDTWFWYVVIEPTCFLDKQNCLMCALKHVKHSMFVHVCHLNEYVHIFGQWTTISMSCSTGVHLTDHKQPLGRFWVRSDMPRKTAASRLWTNFPR